MSEAKTVTEPVAEPAAVSEPAAPVHVRAADRAEAVPLEWPLHYDGKTVDSVTVKRLTTGEIADFIEQNGATTNWRDFPMFDQPPAVLRALDDDDAENVLTVFNRFLPRRFRAGPE